MILSALKSLPWLIIGVVIGGSVALSDSDRDNLETAFTDALSQNQNTQEALDLCLAEKDASLAKQPASSTPVIQHQPPSRPARKKIDSSHKKKPSQERDATADLLRRYSQTLRNK